MKFWPIDTWQERMVTYPRKNQRRSGGMVDALDSKSGIRKSVRVQVPSPVSKQTPVGKEITDRGLYFLIFF